jgi:RNA polymerase sigma factor (sigma-70 family)
MADSNDFSLLMQRIREGSDDAVKELLEVYGPHILRVVRRRLNQNLRSKFDSQDFVQSVWASFFAIRPNEYMFDRPEALITFLVNLARNKVVDCVRQRFQTTIHTVNREHSLDGSAAYALEMEGQQPSPSQVALAKEEWDRLLDSVPAYQRPILTLLWQGHTQQEIAQQLGVGEKTIRRIVRRIAPENRIYDGLAVDNTDSVSPRSVTVDQQVEPDACDPSPDPKLHGD